MVKLDDNNNNGYWFALLFLALFFAVAGTNSAGLLAMLFFLVSIGLLVAGIGSLEKTLEEFAVEEESGEAEEKEAEKEGEMREGEDRFRLNDEAKIKNEIAGLRQKYRSGKVSRRKYRDEFEDLRNELAELKTGMELHAPGKAKTRR